MTTFLLLWFGSGLLGYTITEVIDRKILRKVRRDTRFVGELMFYSFFGFSTLGIALIRVLFIDNHKIAIALNSRRKNRAS